MKKQLSIESKLALSAINQNIRALLPSLRSKKLSDEKKSEIIKILEDLRMVKNNVKGSVSAEDRINKIILAAKENVEQYRSVDQKKNQ